MTVYFCENTEWERIEEFWNNQFPNEYKNETVFQMEPFPKEGLKSITFISNDKEAVKLVSEKFELRKNDSWNSVGAQGLKRLTGEKSQWVDVPLKKIIEYKPMTKEQLQIALDKLRYFYSEFTKEYRDYQNGKNKKIKANAYNNIKITIRLTEEYICQTEEIMEILCDGDTSDYDRAIILGEFRSPGSFKSDMSKLIQDVKSKLDKMH